MTRASRRQPVEIAAGVHCLGVLGANVAFVQARDGWSLIDTAWAHCAGAIADAAQGLFGPGARPAAILLTHLHPDHAGSALDLARRWQRPVHVLRAEQPMATGTWWPEDTDAVGRWTIGPLTPAAVSTAEIAGAPASVAGRMLPSSATSAYSAALDAPSSVIATTAPSPPTGWARSHCTKR